MAPGGLLERDGELRALADLCVRARAGAGGLIVIDGPAGVGKTSLLRATRTAAREAGLTTLSARGAELERAFAFGVVHQLFDAALRDTTLDRATLFAGAARLAAPLLEVELGEAAAPPEDPFAIRHALYWLTANLAGARPLALLVDDAQLADGDSLGFLAHLANRLDGIAVALIVAARSDEAGAPLDALRDHAARHGRLLRLAPLGADAAATVVRALAPAADDALCRACHVATGGNPFLLEQLARAGELDPARVAELSPDVVTRDVAARLERLPPASARLARAAAVLGNGIALREAATLAEVDEAELTGAAEALLSAGVLGSLDPVDFLHPLVRTAVYAGIGPAARWSEHARAARLLADGGASTERVAAQLLRTRPAGDAWACERLVAAARLAAARGAPEPAATYLRRALEEPAPAAQRPRLLLELGGAAAKASDLAAIEHLREALAGELSGDERFAATMLLAGLLGFAWRVEEAVELLEQQVAALGDHPPLQRTAEAALVNLARIDGRTRARGLAVAQRLEEAVAAGEENPAVLGTVAAELAMAGAPHERTAAVAEAALRQVTGGSAAPDWSAWNAIRALVTSERWEGAARALEWALEAARERGALLDVGNALIFRTELQLRLGELAAAEVDARALGEIASAYGSPMGEGFTIAWLATVLLERGALDEAAQLFVDDRFGGAAATVPHAYPSTWLLLARGRLRWAQGHLEEAAEDIREAGRRADAIGHLNPVVAGWRAPLAELLVALGQPAEARRLAREQQGLAEAFGAPLGLALAAGTSALVEDDPGTRLALRREAAALLDGSRVRLEAARAQAALGAELQQAGMTDGARDALRQAADLAHACGAVLLEEETLAQLRATGARPPRRDPGGAGALTPSERRIAALAAAGRQDREIAETLFVTTHTVEFHLRNACRKLGVASRAELAAALGDD